MRWDLEVSRGSKLRPPRPSNSVTIFFSFFFYIYKRSGDMMTLAGVTVFIGSRSRFSRGTDRSLELDIGLVISFLS